MLPLAVNPPDQCREWILVADVHQSLMGGKPIVSSGDQWSGGIRKILRLMTGQFGRLFCQHQAMS